MVPVARSALDGRSGGELPTYQSVPFTKKRGASVTNTHGASLMPGGQFFLSLSLQYFLRHFLSDVSSVFLSSLAQRGLFVVNK